MSDPSRNRAPGASPAPADEPTLLHAFFAAAAARWPAAVAIDVPPGEGRAARATLTYAELECAASRLATLVRPHVRGECVVAILVGRGTPLLYAAQLACLQVGAAYTYLDASLPDEHLRHVLADSGAVAVVADTAGRARLAALRSELPSVDVGATTPASAAAAPSWLTPSSLAYVIYTSGTTGRPKGVLIEHRGAVNLVAADLRAFGLGPGDRVAQGSSPAYDSSVEETWLALAAGATLVVMDEAAARLGPDLVAWLRAERVTVFCPPPTQLRAMACKDPARELPDLRLLYVGGEALPQDLSDLWADACWLENGYGPTECTVTVLRGRMRRGTPVHIGRPVEGHTAWILDAALQPVPDGTPGELCLAGPGLARGYLHQPDLTAARFPTHDELGRLYRTGDLVQRDADGNLRCLGRIDTQVKVRGYRIELEAIEATLAACEGVRHAACRVQGEGENAEVVAFVVARRPDAPPDGTALRAALAARLPEYMVPAHVAFVAHLPTTVGGKLDRRALPDVSFAATAQPPAARPPRDALEARLADALARFLPGGPALSVDDDFFARGGDSLRAARAISALRADPVTAALTVRDIYTARTVEGLASILRTAIPSHVAAPAADATPVATHAFLVTAAQLAFLAVGLVVGSGILYLAAFEVLPLVLDHIGPVLTVLALPLLWPLLTWAWVIGSLACTVLAKRVLIGRYAPGRIPVWSSAFLRQWIVQRCARLVPWAMLQGTELQCIALRLLGARIGQRVHIHRGVDLTQGGWDLLTLGDDVSLNQDAALLLTALDDGHVVVAPIEIGTGCTVEVRACVSGGAVMEQEGHLQASAWLPAGARVPAATRFDGVPAQAVGPAPAPAAITLDEPELTPWAHAARMLAARSLLRLTVALPGAGVAALALGGAGVDAASTLAWLEAPWSGALWIVIAVTIGLLPLTLFCEALLARWLAPPQPGVMRRLGRLHVRTQFVTGLVESAGEWLSGTLFWPTWLRLAGMRVGRRCEISTIIDVVPRHVSIGETTFFADGIYLAGPRIHRGVVELQATRLGARTFLGNHVVVPVGQQLPDDLLLGVSTVADDRTMRADSGWFGHPPFELPRREVVVADRRLTHEPGFLRFTNRVSWEALRFALPVVPLVLGLWWYAALVDAAQLTLVDVAFGIVPQVTFAVAVAACMLVLALKWGLLGRVRPGQHALWSCWSSRWDFLYVAWNRFARPILQNLEGTLLLPWYLRAMGARIGRRTVLGPGFAQLVDPDMIRIEDGATVDAQFQAHSFEDRILKIDHLHVRALATVGHGTVLLYGADVGAGASVAPHSVVMKHEWLAPRQRHAGFPTRAIAPHAPTVHVPEALAPAADRELAFDAARGLAVLCMMVEHFVPTEGGEGVVADAITATSRFAYGKSAPLFCMLLGAGMALAARHRPVAARHHVRRALGLLVLGQVFAWTWTTEILMPLGLMTLLCAPFLTRRPTVVFAALVGLLAVAPWLGEAFAAVVTSDWLEDGSHLRDHGFGWHTARYFLIDGNYPLVPWLAFAWLGVWFVGKGLDAVAGAERRLWVVLPLAVAAQGHALWAAAQEDLDPAWASTWVPTSLPFVVVGASWALVMITLLQVVQTRAPRAMVGLAALGRTSLTHYFGHIVLAYAALRFLYGGEEWSVTAGVAGMAMYLACAWPLTQWWLARARRGPAEALLARIAGRRS